MARILRGPKGNITHVFYGKKFRSVNSVSEVKSMLSDLTARVSGLMSGRRMGLAEAKRRSRAAREAARSFQQTYNSEMESEDSEYATQPRNHNTLGDPFKGVGNSDPASRQDEGTRNLYKDSEGGKMRTSGDATKVNTYGNKFPAGKSHESIRTFR